MHKDIKDLSIRLILCFLPISWIAAIFTPLTIFATSFFLQIGYDPIIIGQTIIIKEKTFRIIEACIASGAYYLLWILIMLTRDITWKQRRKLFIVCWSSLLIFNLARIIGLIVIADKGGWDAFNTVHLLLWKFVAGIAVAIIWISAISFYKIKSIPVYDDLKWLLQQSYFKKSNKNVFKGRDGHNS